MLQASPKLPPSSPQRSWLVTRLYAAEKPIRPATPASAVAPTTTPTACERESSGQSSHDPSAIARATATSDAAPDATSTTAAGPTTSSAIVATILPTRRSAVTAPKDDGAPSPRAPLRSTDDQ